ncbi:uncharacterized protein LOC129592391 [Paramacrobiotus metropolitanus]|uniref:uncharacterized protein LOC129592391 n=1 Tax=Paramacrobiotus metropolitanus TaxID=2943436 RepID=UPI0024462BEA|nr:uncharacterized protein LOC129592391 [Paramacrobiotus metropolitanus]XP_055344396.1 uncharacterized protein LOC129592391 [Paramacrobiotus metropolitanus]
MTTPSDTQDGKQSRREEAHDGATSGAPSVAAATATNGSSGGSGAVKEKEPSKAPPEWAKEREDAVNNSSITNSEDSKLLRARIFVGNLPADLRTERGELFDKFRKYGRILGVSIHNRFAFVQYEREDDAKNAVKEEHRTELRSARLDVKMSMEGRVNNRDRDRDRDRERDRDRDRDRRRSRSRSPIDRRRSRSRSPPRRSRDRDYRRYSADRYRESRERTPPPYVPIPVEERFCHPRTYGPNDVEMVIIRKQQGQYADSILRRLYDRRIAANMLFLAEHASLEGAVTEFGRTGSHYVIIIMPKHEDTRAITVNIFETNEKPREYRNINVEEGVSLIHRHFRDHYPALARLREMEYQGAGFYPTGPSEVMRCLARMVETCAVPTSSLDQTIRYLQDMRDRTAIAEGIPVNTAAAAPPSAALVVPQSAAAAAAYRAPAVDNGIGKLLGQLDGRGGAPAEESVRESLLGLLKATGLVGNLGGQVQAQPPQHAGYAPATAATTEYYNQPAGYAASSTSSSAPYSANPQSGGPGTTYGQASGGQYSSSTPAAPFSSGAAASQYGGGGQGDRTADGAMHKMYDNLVSTGTLRAGSAMSAHTASNPVSTTQGQGNRLDRGDERERQPPQQQQQPTTYRTTKDTENGMDYGGMHGGGMRYEPMSQQPTTGQYAPQTGRNGPAGGGQDRGGPAAGGGASAAGQAGGYATGAGAYMQRQQQPVGQPAMAPQGQYATGRR